MLRFFHGFIEVDSSLIFLLTVESKDIGFNLLASLTGIEPMSPGEREAFYRNSKETCGKHP